MVSSCLFGWSSQTKHVGDLGVWMHVCSSLPCFLSRLSICLSASLYFYLLIFLCLSWIWFGERTLHVCDNLHIIWKQYGSSLEFIAIRSVHSDENALFQVTGREEEVSSTDKWLGHPCLLSNWSKGFGKETRKTELCGATGDNLFPKTRVMMEYLPPDHLTVSSCPLDAFLSLAYSMSWECWAFSGLFESYPKDAPLEGKGNEGNIEYSFTYFWSLSYWKNIQGWGNFGVLFP